jgi:hypothetical protein
LQESVNETLHRKACVPYWHNWVWMCAPAHGAVWTWRDDRLCWRLGASGFPPPSWSPAFFHIFGWKAAPNWTIDSTGFRGTSWAISNFGSELAFGPLLPKLQAKGSGAGVEL